MSQTDTDKLIKTLKNMGKSDAEIRAEQIGELIGTLVVFLGLATSIWAILNFIFAINIAWIKIAGGLMLFNLFRNLVLKPIFKG